MNSQVRCRPNLSFESEMRDEVKSRGLDRPEWTRNERERRIGELEI
jgi:hypothetical protein